LEKEKRQLEIKLDKLDKLSRALQQERSDLQATIKNLSKSATTTISSSAVSSTPMADIPISSEEVINEHEVMKNDSVQTTTFDTNGSIPVVESPNLYDSELGRIAKTVD